jgi:hypothetical protein
MQQTARFSKHKQAEYLTYCMKYRGRRMRGGGKRRRNRRNRCSFHSVK